MKIGNASNRPVSGTFGAARQASGASRTDAPSSKPVLSDEPKLSRLSAHLSNNSAAHQAQLSKLEAAVAGGTYSPDAGAVSESILRYSMGLFSPGVS